MRLQDIEIINQCMSQRTFDPEMFHAWERIKSELVVSQNTPTNKESTPCQHAFYVIKFGGKVRCNKCEAEFPIISTC